MTKKIYIMLLSVFLSVTYLSAQVVQIVNVSTAGGLATAIGSNLKTVTDLTLTGTINATDFNTIKQMTALKNLDMSQVAVVDNTIPASAFQSRVLNSLVLPSTIRNISYNAFSYANLKNTLVLPSSISIIRDYAFNSYQGKIDFSGTKTNLTTLGYGFINGYTQDSIMNFSEFSKLINFGIKENEVFGTFRGYNGEVILPNNLTVLPKLIFGQFRGTYRMPEGITEISYNAFSHAKLKNSLVLPTSVSIIRDFAFDSYQGKIDFSGTKTNLTTLGHGFINGYTQDSIMNFSEFSKLINFGIKENEVFGTFRGYNGEVILPNNLTVLPKLIFGQFRGTYRMPEGITEISYNAFSHAKLKNSLVLPTSVSIIRDFAFDSYQGKIDFSRTKTSLTTLGHGFINGYTQDSIMNFSEFSKLINFGIKENEVFGTFRGYNGEVILPNNLTVLPKFIFSQFRGTVILPQGLKTIGESAFHSSTIKKIDLPSGVTSIGTNAFYNATQLDTIISRNPTLPTLGANIFYGVNKETTVLKVPDSSINLYGIAAQWKDFLNISGRIPSKLDLTYKITSLVYMGGDNWSLEAAGSNHLEIPYQAVRIGEYYWMNTNFNHKEPKRQNFSANPISLKAGDENNYPLTQAILDKYLDQVLLDKSKFQVDIDQFTKDYGSYYSFETRNFMKNWGRIYESGNITKAANWKMPVLSDVRQLLAMSPFSQNNVVKHLNHFDVMYALNAKSTTNEMSKYIVPGQCGSTYWFNVFGDVGGNKYGFNLMPNGARQQDDYHWNTSLCTTPKGEYETFPAPKGHIFQIFYIARFTTQNGDIKIHDQIEAETVQGAWQTVRWCRVLSDEELGYKLYINIPNINKNSTQWNSFVSGDEIPLLNYLRNNCIPTDQASIIKLGLNESVPSGYIELPHGYLRGFYVQYILDNPASEVTVGEVIEYAYNVEDSALQYDYKNPFGRESLKVCSTTTRTVESDDVVVPFKADASVTLYPNPVQDVLNISGDGVEKVTIYDMSGRQVSTAKNVNTISVSDLSKGTYLVRVLTANGESTHKVIKK